MTRSHFVRFSLAAIFSLFGVLFFLESGHTQPIPENSRQIIPANPPTNTPGTPTPPTNGFPPPGGFPIPPPGGFPASPPGTPGAPGGAPPTPGTPKSPAPTPPRPGFPPPPSSNFPTPPTGPGRANPPMAGRPGGMPSPGMPSLETVWTCTKCGKELGQGSTKPSYTSCPFCKASFINNGGALFSRSNTTPITTSSSNNSSSSGVKETAQLGRSIVGGIICVVFLISSAIAYMKKTAKARSQSAPRRFNDEY